MIRNMEYKGPMFDSNGRPIRPDYGTIRKDDGSLQDQYKLTNPGELKLNTQGLEALRKQALAAPGSSVWHKMAMDKQGLEQTAQADLAAKQNAGAMAQAQSGLAMRGGLGSGARERMLKTGMGNNLMAAQTVARQGQMDRSNIGLQDEMMRQQTLSQLPQQELQALQPQMYNNQQNLGIQQWNMGQAIADQRGQNLYNTNSYAEDMQGWAAAQQAAAMAAQANKSGGGINLGGGIAGGGLGGAAIGSVLGGVMGPVGNVVGGLFGGGNK